jgi:formate/nitrite transporter FocA (FNT family)
VASDEKSDQKKQELPVHESNTPETGTKFSAEEVHQNVLEMAQDELERPVVELATSGLAAGLGIGFSFLAVTLLTSRMAPENHALAAGIAYPLGFIFVVLAAHQLFTENTLDPVIPLLEERTGEKLGQVLRLWAIVLPANLVGALIFSFVLAHTKVLDPALNGPLMDVARETTKGEAVVVFYKAIWAGWLVALMSWILAAARDTTSQILAIWLTTAPIAAFGFKHSIAGATEMFYRSWMGDASWGDALLRFEIPALLGNIVGGVVLVALVNHGQAGGKSK